MRVRRSAYAADALAVLLLVYRLVALVRHAHVRAHGVHQPEARAAAVGPAVGQQDGGGAAAEEAVGEQHRLFVAAVPVLRDVLGRDDERERVAWRWKERGHLNLGAACGGCGAPALRSARAASKNSAKVNQRRVKKTQQ